MYIKREMSRLSVAIPVFNEERVLPELLRRLGAVLDAIPGGPHEMVFVDDGSSDGSLPLLEEASRTDPRVVAVSLSRNFGHQAALAAALDHVTGDRVVMMDADLQDLPEAIPTLIAKADEGHDVVYAIRTQRKEGPLLRLCYFAYYRIVRMLAETPLPLDAGDFALMSRRAVDAVRRNQERQRYLRGLRAWVGFRQAGVHVERGPRAAGESKYTPGKLFRLAFDGLLAFSVVPLRAATLLGLASILMSSVYVAYAVWVKLATGNTPQGFTALIAAMVFLSGVQFVFLGIIGEYVGRVYIEVKGRPNYVVERIVRGG